MPGVRFLRRSRGAPRAVQKGPQGTRVWPGVSWDVRFVLVCLFRISCLLGQQVSPDVCLKLSEVCPKSVGLSLRHPGACTTCLSLVSASFPLRARRCSLFSGFFRLSIRAVPENRPEQMHAARETGSGMVQVRFQGSAPQASLRLCPNCGSSR